MKTTSLETASQLIRAARDQGLLDDEDSLAIFIDLSLIADRIRDLKGNFCSDALHAVAIKSNPLRFVLQHLVTLGVGLEAASFAEVLLAQAAGAPIETIVFDSPAKTRQEIGLLQQDFRGLRVNADSIDELRRYDALKPGLRLGLRINPLILADTDASMSVSGVDAKFGEPITNKNAIVQACRDFGELDCLHLHIGSQYSDLGPTTRAVRTVADLAGEINSKLGRRQITFIDIGGGFPVNYFPGEPFRIESYAQQLSQAVPELFDGTFRAITEFGRYVHANAAFAWTTIEYVKPFPGGLTAITHAGADNFLRECYNPEAWHHEIGVLDQHTGFPKQTDDRLPTHVAGPLCFGGDFVARNRKLPPVTAGDGIVIMDVGANTFSLFSRHCSRPFPKFIAYSSDQHASDLHIAKPKESLDSVLKFWS